MKGVLIMTVNRLIELLQKVEHKEMDVKIRMDDKPDVDVDFAYIEHELTDDSMSLILEGME